MDDELTPLEVLLGACDDGKPVPPHALAAVLRDFDARLPVTEPVTDTESVTESDTTTTTAAKTTAKKG